MAMPDLTNKTFLVVDDDDIVLSATQEMLSETGSRIHYAADSYNAIRFFKQQYRCIDMVLLDLDLPDLDGFSTFKIMRRYGPDNPIIVCSAYADSAEFLPFAKAQAIEYLYKPFKAVDLATKLARYF